MHPRSQVLIYINARGRWKQHNMSSEILNNQKHVYTADSALAEKEPRFQILNGCVYRYFYEYV